MRSQNIILSGKKFLNWSMSKHKTKLQIWLQNIYSFKYTKLTGMLGAATRRISAEGEYWMRPPLSLVPLIPIVGSRNLFHSLIHLPYSQANLLASGKPYVYKLLIAILNNFDDWILHYLHPNLALLSAKFQACDIKMQLLLSFLALSTWQISSLQLLLYIWLKHIANFIITEDFLFVLKGVISHTQGFGQ